jgi:hypothetical protein
MKAIAYISSYIAATLLALSFFFGLQHFPGVEHLAQAGIAFVLLSSVLHLIITLLNYARLQRMQMLRLISGNIGLILVTLGGLSKIQHWPIANAFLLPGIAILITVFLPLFYLYLYRISIANDESTNP